MGFLSSGLYAIICYQSLLYLETGLQVFYLIASVWGWYKWSNFSNTKKSEISISRNSIPHNLISILILLIISIFLGKIFSSYTQAAMPYIDAPISVFSIYATYLTAEKKIENWLYWVVINSASIYLFYKRGLELTSLLYFGYLIMAIIGYLKWQKGNLSRKAIPQ